jgi:hypothetical protein
MQYVPQQQRGGCVFCCLPLLVLMVLAVLTLLLGATWAWSAR